MDILMTYWNSVWRAELRQAEISAEAHTTGEWAAYDRSLRRSSPMEKVMRKSGFLSASGTS